MNSIIERGNLNLKRLNEIGMRIADFRQKLMGALPPQPATDRPPTYPASSLDVFTDKSHSLLGEMEERLSEIEVNINKLDEFFFNPASVPSKAIY